MDFIKILRSLEEFLYEVMTWLAFYPRTLWRILRRPVESARYVSLQLRTDKESQFADGIGPPLFLILSLLLAHVLELASPVPFKYAPTRLGDIVFGSDQALLAFRAVTFSFYALLAALWVLRQQGKRADRDTLREPFFIEAYLIAPLVLILAVAMLLLRQHDELKMSAGIALLLVGIVWYLHAQSRVHQELLGISALRAGAYAAISFAATTTAVIGILLALKIG